MTIPMPAPAALVRAAPATPADPPSRTRARALALVGAVAALVGLAAGPAAAGGTGGSSVATFDNAGQTEVVRWDPCTPIGYRVNAALGGRRALADVQAAVARLSTASGLTFRYLGSTTAVPGSPDGPATAAPLVIAWVRPGSASRSPLAPGDVGRGGWTASTSSSGHVEITHGYVVVRAGARLAAGFGPGVTRGRVLLHELGHAVGLEHVQDPGMVMDPVTASWSPAAAYGAGDLAGLRRVGSAAGCVA